jgi:hypothetical protein
MDMKRALGNALVLYSLIITLTASGESLAARKPPNATSDLDSKSMVAVRPASPHPKPAPAVRPAASPHVSSSRGKSHRPTKILKKTVPKAVVQPRTDLIHYGVLEDSQRYDPRPPADSAGVLHPDALDLTHDHFQELDRNQDGKIDPVERAFGRIDMDRDLPTRTLQ